MNRAIFPAALAAVFLAACVTLYDTAVTTTEVVKSAMTDWSDLSVSGRTTKEIDAKVIAAHGRYQQACAVARDALVAYQKGGDQATYQKAFEATRAAMNALVDIIIPLLTPTKAVELQSKIGRATKP